MKNVSPSISLRPYIDRYVIDEKTEGAVYKVYPATSVVVGFQYSGTLAAVSDDTIVRLSGAGVTGLSDRYKVFKSFPDTGTILVYFTATGAAAFFKNPVHEIFGGSYSLKDFFPESLIMATEEQLREARDDVQRIAIVEAFLLAGIRDVREDKMVSSALQIINAASGNVRMAALSSELNISISRMEKRFRKIAGASPKKYAAIVRFNAMLNDHTAGKPYMHTAYRLGYFDQAHFIKDFKAFTGQAPERYFSVDRSSPDPASPKAVL